jgi:hypothetical protein
VSPTETLSWLAPAPTWGQAGFGVGERDFLRPWIAEFDNDQFLAEFLGLMAGDAGAVPSRLAARQPAVQDATTQAWRLYQPLHQRYYLVTASLVCRTVGIPDRAVALAHGESTSFVMRRWPSGDSTKEQAWIAAASTWLPVTAGTGPVDGEERLPLHAAPVGAFADPASVPGALGMAEDGRRRVYYGYVPSGRRERLVPPMDPAVAAANLQAINQGPHGTTDPNPEDPRLDELMIRFVLPWQSALQAPGSSHSNGDTQVASLNLVLDLGDWLSRWLPTLYAALGANSLPAGSPGVLQTVLDNLNAIQVQQFGPTATISLRQALVNLEPWAYLVSGAGPDYSGPKLDLTIPNPGGILGTWISASPVKGKFAQDAAAALGKPGDVLIPVPDELKPFLRDDPAPGTDPKAREAQYVAYTVYEHDPCLPVMSPPSAAFTLAPAMDPDAPARIIRLQLPDIGHMRRFKRGVGLEMPPKVRQLVDRVNVGLLKGDPLGDDPGLELGMICSFSLQIIFLVAFMVMFIFLIAFNIIFWWLAFLKICFPIPHRKS